MKEMKNSFKVSTKLFRVSGILKIVERSVSGVWCVCSVRSRDDASPLKYKLHLSEVCSKSNLVARLMFLLWLCSIKVTRRLWCQTRRGVRPLADFFGHAGCGNEPLDVWGLNVFDQIKTSLWCMSTLFVGVGGFCFKAEVLNLCKVLKFLHQNHL